jgi:hypothetical protein
MFALIQVGTAGQRPWRLHKMRPQSSSRWAGHNTRAHVVEYIYVVYMHVFNAEINRILRTPLMPFYGIYGSVASFLCVYSPSATCRETAVQLLLCMYVYVLLLVHGIGIAYLCVSPIYVLLLCTSTQQPLHTARGCFVYIHAIKKLYVV